MGFRVIVALFALVFAQVGLAQPEAAVWLKRMSDSHRTLNYQGVVNYQVEGNTRSFKVRHVVRDGREYESLEALSGAEPEVVRGGHDVNCLHPGPELLGILAASGDESSSLQKFYRLSLGDDIYVAGRNAVSVLVEPRDVYRLGYRLALDKETGLLLRSETLNRRERVLERFEYVVLDLQFAGDDHHLEPGQWTSHGEFAPAPKELPVRQWRLNWLPQGFSPLRQVGIDRDSASYTDGLAVFTVFVEPLSDSSEAAADTHLRRGASVSYSTVMDGGRQRVSVVGEVPMLTARQVARSVLWVAQ